MIASKAHNYCFIFRNSEISHQSVTNCLHNAAARTITFKNYEQGKDLRISIDTNHVSFPTANELEIPQHISHSMSHRQARNLEVKDIKIAFNKKL
jgi:hypothetical protein